MFYLEVIKEICNPDVKSNGKYISLLKKKKSSWKWFAFLKESNEIIKSHYNYKKQYWEKLFY